jgi:hypothetical protein
MKKRENPAEVLEKSGDVSRKKLGRRKDLFSDKSIVKLTKRYRDKSYSKIKKEKSILPKPKEEDTFQFFNTKKSKKSKISLIIPEKESLISKINERLMFLSKILLVIVIVLVVIGLFYYLLTNSSRNLEVGENIEKAYVKAGILHISLAPNDLAKVSKIRFVFLGEKEYYLTSRDSKFDYEFNAADLGIKSLGEIEKVSAVLEY